jgi:hypothetical protein
VNRAARHASLILAVFYAAFLVASLVAVPILAPEAKIPNPFGPDEASRNFFLNNPEAVRVSDLLQLASAVCLGALAAAISAIENVSRRSCVASRLTLAGGVGGAILLALGALCSWALASPGAVDPGSSFRTLQFLPFLMGEPGWAGFFALFLAGVARTLDGILSRWVVWSGYFLSFIAALATLVLITINAAVCLPVARFLGFLWLILVSLQLTRSRERRG